MKWIVQKPASTSKPAAPHPRFDGGKWFNKRVEELVNAGYTPRWHDDDAVAWCWTHSKYQVNRDTPAIVITFDDTTGSVTEIRIDSFFAMCRAFPAIATAAMRKSRLVETAK